MTKIRLSAASALLLAVAGIAAVTGAAAQHQVDTRAGDVGWMAPMAEDASPTPTRSATAGDVGW